MQRHANLADLARLRAQRHKNLRVTAATLCLAPRRAKYLAELLRRRGPGMLEETAERMYFRFYDPRVLAAFHDAATPPQREALFGEIEAFLVETSERSLRRIPRPARSEPC